MNLNLLNTFKNWKLNRSLKNFPPNLFDESMQGNYRMVSMVSPRKAAMGFYDLALLSPYFSPDPLKKIKGIELKRFANHSFNSIPIEKREDLQKREFIAFFSHTVTFHMNFDQHDELAPFLEKVDSLLDNIDLLDHVFFVLGKDDNLYWNREEYVREGRGYWLVIAGFIDEIEDLDKLTGTEISDSMILIADDVRQEIEDFYKKFKVEKRVKLEQISSRGIICYELLQRLGKSMRMEKNGKTPKRDEHSYTYR